MIEAEVCSSSDITYTPRGRPRDKSTCEAADDLRSLPAGQLLRVKKQTPRNETDKALHRAMRWLNKTQKERHYMSRTTSDDCIVFFWQEEG